MRFEAKKNKCFGRDSRKRRLQRYLPGIIPPRSVICAPAFILPPRIDVGRSAGGRIRVCDDCGLTFAPRRLVRGAAVVLNASKNAHGINWLFGLVK
jgi:hypothetical protein